MSRKLNDVNIDVAAFKRVNTSTSIDRIFVLRDLDDIVELVWSALIATKIIEIEPVSLAALAGDNTHSLDVATLKLAGKDFERRSAQVLVGTIKLLLLPRHEEVNHSK